ncbi:MAG: hypothetical protein WEA75_12655 [Acidimicrobiia bacterium]
MGKRECELLTAVATREVVGAQLSLHGVGEDPKRSVTGLVPVRVVQRLEVVEVGHHEGELDTVVAEVAEAVLERPAVDQPGQAVGRGLYVRLRHDAEHPETVAGVVGERLQRVHRALFERPLGLAHGVDDAHGATHDRDGQAHS